MFDALNLKAVGHISSIFKQKNGTPRQPSVAMDTVAKLTISKDIFNNPQHSLEGLEAFSHVWIIFVFHQNKNRCAKAKVKPPRLDGRKTGLYSTRCPYRPNPIGLTLAKLDRIQGATLHLRGIDMLDGTPVIDIKPYIPQYDIPHSISTNTSSEACPPNTLKDFAETTDFDSSDGNGASIKRSQSTDGKCTSSPASSTSIDVIESTTAETEVILGNEGTVSCTAGSDLDSNNEHVSVDDKVCHGSVKGTPSSVVCDINTTNSLISDSHKNSISSIVARECTQSIDTGFQSENTTNQSGHQVSSVIDIAKWITAPPIIKLAVRFTCTAKKQLAMFSGVAQNQKYRLEHLETAERARHVIGDILSADPRSSYRRNHSQDRLYYFAIDSIHVTCWFDEDTVEVVRVQPVSDSPLST